MYSVAFNYMFQNFAANDFVVLYTNPRGSTGYGGAFANGINHNYPGSRLRRPDGRGGCGHRQGLRGSDADVRRRAAAAAACFRAG